MAIRAFGPFTFSVALGIVVMTGLWYYEEQHTAPREMPGEFCNKRGEFIAAKILHATNAKRDSMSNKEYRCLYRNREEEFRNCWMDCQIH